jgi:hypothetical protein
VTAERAGSVQAILLSVRRFDHNGRPETMIAFSDLDCIFVASPLYRELCPFAHCDNGVSASPLRLSRRGIVVDAAVLIASAARSSSTSREALR